MDLLAGDWPKEGTSSDGPGSLLAVARSELHRDVAAARAARVIATAADASPEATASAARLITAVVARVPAYGGLPGGADDETRETRNHILGPKCDDGPLFSTAEIGQTAQRLLRLKHETMEEGWVLPSLFD